MFDFRAWLRKTFTPLVGAGTCAAIMAGQANAGNITLTGHDDDYHFNFGAGPGVAGDAGKQIAAMVAFARAGNAPANKANPVLVFDQGTELTTALTALAIPFTNINPASGAINPANFDVTKYSAIVIASASSCGGCDNTVKGFNNISADKAAIAAFINAGGGVAQFTGGTTATSRKAAYAYLPATGGVAVFGTPPTAGYFQTPAGKNVGIGAVNNDTTHNFFSEPGVGGTSTAYKVFERNKEASGATPAETIGVTSAYVTRTGIHGTPEPATLGLAAMGLASLAGYGLRKRGKKKDL
jgi:hypothetical protein